MRAMKPFMLLFVLVVWACTPAGTPVPLGETDAPAGASTLTPVLETDPPIATGTSTARRETAEPMLSGIQGTVRASGSDLPAAGVFVQARDHAGVTVTAISDSTGEFRIADLPPGSYRVSAHGTGFQQATFVEVTLSGEEDARLDWTLSPVEDIHPQLSGSAWLSLLPDDEHIRQFILDCQGCHQLSWVRQRYRGWPSEAAWKSSIEKMLQYYGPQSGFPIIGPMDPAATASWLARYLTEEAPIPEPSPALGEEAARVRITEYPFPGAGPHDLVLDQNGQVIVTGMFSNDMWSLDPASGEFRRYSLPANANPRAVEIDSQGRWWIVFGNPFQVARFDPGIETLDTTPVGLYAHSIALDAAGNAFVNGHFKANPGKVVMLDSDGTRVETFDIPDNNSSNLSGLPISYDLRVDAQGMLWGSDLNWNRIYRLDPGTGAVKHFELPHPASGPRRFDIDENGDLWIPEFSGSRLAKFDPETEQFTEWETPTRHAEPYVVKVDSERDLIWIGYAGADRVARFDPATETFTEYPLPTQFALIRHMAIEEATGDVWFSYHHVPTAQDKVVRLQTLE